jgi:hypothetical protein
LPAHVGFGFSDHRRFERQAIPLIIPVK